MLSLPASTLESADMADMARLGSVRTLLVGAGLRARVHVRAQAEGGHGRRGDALVTMHVHVPGALLRMCSCQAEVHPAPPK